MTLSVRFSPDLQGKLTEYCWLTGATKSLVLQQPVLEYLVRRTAMAAIRRRRTPNGAARSAHSARSPGNCGHGIVCRPVRPE